MDLSRYNPNKFFKNDKISGLSMIEVLIVVTIIALLVIAGLSYVPKQLQKARDGKRKSDLNKIQTAFEHYYSDRGSYPGVTVLENCGVTTPVHPLHEYLANVPCDPLNESPYLYAPHDNDGGTGTDGGYRVWTKLEKDDDPVIADLGCDGVTGCGAGIYFATLPNAEEYNYGVSEGVPVLNSSAGSYLTSGDCCNIEGGTCESWSYGSGTCVNGPHPIGTCDDNTSCTY